MTDPPARRASRDLLRRRAGVAWWLAGLTWLTCLAARADTFSTPGTSTYTVPAGVTRLQVQVSGAGGGGGEPVYDLIADRYYLQGGRGGAGRLITTTLNVTPGQQLTIVVGAGGGVVNSPEARSQATGGSSSAGSGGTSGAATRIVYWRTTRGGGQFRMGDGGGGGGASSIALSGTVILKAGGGGGGAGRAVETAADLTNYPPTALDGADASSFTRAWNCSAAATGGTGVDGDAESPRRLRSGGGGGGGGYTGGAGGIGQRLRATSNPSTWDGTPAGGGGSCASANTTFFATSVSTRTGAGGGASRTAGNGGYVVVTPLTVTSGGVSGTVFDDKAGDLLADGSVNDAANNNAGIAGATVRLFNGSGAQVASQTTTNTGSYSFSGLAAANYYVTVDAPRVVTTISATTYTGIAEQTYASAGLGNDTTNPGGFGTICAGAEPAYTPRGNPVTGNTARNPVNGACYGGRRGATADAVNTTTPQLDQAEHVIRVAVGSTTSVTLVDFGFSFNVMTNVNATGQGSLDQFGINTNAIAGHNDMRFVPAVLPNQSVGTNSWWSERSNGAFVADDVVIDGRAYSNVDGRSNLDRYNSAVLGTGGRVGVGNVTLPTLNGPELEVYAWFRLNSATIRNMALWGWEASTPVIRGSTLIVENNVFGSSPVSWPSGTGSMSAIDITTRLTARNNLFLKNEDAAFVIRTATFGGSADVVIEANEFRDVGTAGVERGIDSQGVNGNSSISGNLISMARAHGIYLTPFSSTARIENNTIESQQANADAIYINATGSNLNILNNVVTNNGATSRVAVSGIALGTSARGVKISRNKFGGNFGNAIDLGDNGVSGNDAADATRCAASGTGGANNNLARPTITSATINGSNVDVQGQLCDDGGTYTIELYAAQSADGDGSPAAGEGVRFLTETTGLTGATFAASIPLANVTTGAITAVAIRTTAGTTGTAGDTSEFSANTVVADPSVTISGRVFKDTTADLLNDGDIGDSNNPAINGATVRLYDASGASTGQQTTTAADGTYLFRVTAGRTYYVTVDAPKVTGSTLAVAEQTYASAGTNNDAGNAKGFGAICAGLESDGNPYAGQSNPVINAAHSNRVNGACYGGRRGDIADDTDLSTTSLDEAEHVIRLAVGAVNVTAVDFGFSFNAVTNVNATGQGTIRQFATNTVVLGGSAMRFVPAVQPNLQVGANRWWQDTNSLFFSNTVAANTIIDGSAYSNVDGLASLAHYNSAVLGSGGTVGVAGVQLPKLDGPELELRIGFTLGSGCEVRNLAFTAFGTSNRLFDLFTATGAIIENNVIGSPPNSYPSGNGGGLIWVRTSGATIRNNLFLKNDAATVAIEVTAHATNPNEILIEGNEIRDVGTSGTEAGINVSTGASVVSIEGNLISIAQGYGLRATGTGTGPVNVENNTIQSQQSTADAMFVDASGGSFAVASNILTNNGATSGVAASGIALGVNARGIRISQNKFGGNRGNAIDLGNNGVSGNDAADATRCTASGTGGSNNNLARPRITSVTFNGSDLNVQGELCDDGGIYTIELYAAEAVDGDGAPAAGEGVKFLRDLTGLTGATFSTTIPLSSVSTRALTAIAIREVAGDTSEFSENVALPTSATINGRVFEDVAGDLLNGGSVGDGNNPGISGVIVRLFNQGGTQIGTPAVTDETGWYSLSTNGTGTYYVTVDAPTRTGGTGNVVEDVLGEQTYASAGTGNDTSNANGFGTICIASDYVQRANPVTGAAHVNAANGACYGGRRASSSDAVNPAAPALDSAEHVIRIAAGNVDLAGVDFGFSFNAVTWVSTVSGTGQGNVGQFVRNANAIPGPNYLRFVPSMATNIVFGGRRWRSSTVSQYSVDDADTTFDGRAYSNADGTTNLDSTNSVVLGTGGSVGVDQLMLAQVPGPELDLGISFVAAENTTFLNLALTSPASPAIVLGSGGRIENSVVGSSPVSYPAGSGSGHVQVQGTATIRGNLFLKSDAAPAAIQVSSTGAVDGVVIEGNEIRDSGTAGTEYGIDAGGLSGASSIAGNLISIVRGYGIRVSTYPSTARIENNTIDSPQATGDAILVNVPGTNFVVTRNILTNNGSTSSVAGSGVALGANARGIRISRNRFENNFGNAIDLGDNGVSGNDAADATWCTASGTGGSNGNLARPRIISAVRNGNRFDVQGQLCNDSGTYTIELYAARAGSGDGTPAAGEGITYIAPSAGTLTGLTGATFSASIPAASATTTAITALAIRETAGSAGTAGDTSEFSENVALANLAIGGTVFEDRAGDLLSDGTINQAGNTNNIGIGGVIVRLWDRNGAVAAPAQTTAADGTYTFYVSSAGIYYATVDAPTKTGGTTGVTTGVLGEQTYAFAGSNNDTANVDGFGTICVDAAANNYTQRVNPVTGAADGNPANGACYGGRQGAEVDAVNTTTPQLDQAEHVIRIAMGSANITNVDFGFSFNVVTNVRASGQGSVAQFVANANAITGDNVMRFVPAVPTNQTVGTSSWWQNSDSANLILSDDGTTVDGRAYNNADPAADLDDVNPVQLGTGGTVGVEGVTLNKLDAPELEIAANISVHAVRTTLRRLSIVAFTMDIGATGLPADGFVAEDNLFGVQPSEFPGSFSMWFFGMRFLDQAANSIIRRNLFASADGGDPAIMVHALPADLPNVVIEGNEFSGNATGISFLTSGDLTGSISGNLINSGSGIGIVFAPRVNPSSSLTIGNNTIVTSADAIWITNSSFTANDGNVTVRKNVLSNNGGSGVSVSGGNARTTGIRISQNRFGGNGGNSIDLNDDGVSGNTNVCTATNTGSLNNDLARPTITAASYDGSGNLNVQGTYCNDGNTYIIELYEAEAGAGDGTPAAGEGVKYLGSLSGATGAFSGSLTIDAADVPSQITAIAIRDANTAGGTAGDTSEFSANQAVSTGSFITGKVILDDGVGTGGIAHNAVQDGEETGRSPVTLSLTDCANTTHASAVTDTAGQFSLSLAGVPAGAACLVKSPSTDFVPVSANAGTLTGATYVRATDRLEFTIAANTSYSGILLGEVEASRLTSDGIGSVEPGKSIPYSHIYTAGTSANVSFTAVNSLPAWTGVLYIDGDCNTVLDLGQGDELLSNPIAVTKGQQLCLLNLVTSPTGAKDGIVNVTTVSAAEALTPQPVPSAVTVTLTRTDTTTVGQGLSLIKEVRTLTAGCPADAAGSLANAAAFAASNAAEPGQAIEYRISYRNNTADPITSLVIADTAPVGTLFEGAYCLDMPTQGIAGCVPTATSRGNSIVWTFTDATPTPTAPQIGLQPGARGSVGFCAEIQR